MNIYEEYEESYKQFAEGEIITGKIFSTDKDWVLVDIGFTKGKIRIQELQDEDGNLIANEGDSVDVMVEWWDDEEERVLLSKEKADKVKIWEEIEKSYVNDRSVKGVIVNRVKGGFSVDIGVQAFLPSSHIDLHSIRDLNEMVGKTFTFKIIKYNRKRSNIVLSRRAFLEGNSESKIKTNEGQYEPSATKIINSSFSLFFKLTKRANEDLCDIGNKIGFSKEHNAENAHQLANEVIQSLFLQGEPISVYLRNGGEGNSGDTVVKIIFASDADNDNNSKLIKYLSNKTLELSGIEKIDYNEEYTIFLIIGVKIVPRTLGYNNIFSISSEIKFFSEKTLTHFENYGFPVNLLNGIKSLQTQKDHKRTVEERLDDWMLFLDIRERIAKEKQFTLEYKGYRQGSKPRYLIFYLKDSSKSLSIPWDKIKMARGQRIHLKQQTKGSKHNNDNYVSMLVGDIDSCSKEEHSLTIHLDVDMQERLKYIHSLIPQEGTLENSLSGDLAEINNQRRGLQRLINGEANNLHLSKFIFNPKHARIPKIEDKIVLSKDELLLDFLNELQIESVEGALNCSDLYLVKGPPGTGKSTVIAEMCYQFAKRSQRTLIASQSNLAVDNVLSRLKHHKTIRALRVGREEGIEEEGKPFVESQVIDTWLADTAKDCRKEWIERERNVINYNLLSPIKQGLFEYIDALVEIQNIESKIVQEIKEKTSEAEGIKKDIKEIEIKIDRMDVNLEILSDLVEIIINMEDANEILNKSNLFYDEVVTGKSYSLFLRNLSELQKAVTFFIKNDSQTTDISTRDPNFIKDSIYTYQLGLSLVSTIQNIKDDYLASWDDLISHKEKLKEYSKICADIVNTNDSINRLNSRLKNETELVHNLNAKIISIESETSILNQLNNKLNEKGKSIFNEWMINLYNEVMRTLKTESPIYPENLIKVPAELDKFISEKPFFKIWNSVLVEMQIDFAKWFDIFRIVIDRERLLINLQALDTFCDDTIKSIKLELSKLNVSYKVNSNLFTEENYNNILTRMADSNWQLTMGFLNITKRKADSFLGGDNVDGLIDGFLGILSHRAVNERRLRRLRRGLGYFTSLQNLTRKALTDINKLSKDDSILLDKETTNIDKNIVKILKKTTDSFIYQHGIILEKEKDNLKNAQMRLEGAANDLLVEKERVNKLESARKEVSNKIKSTKNHWNILSKYTPHSKMEQISRAICETYEQDNKINQWEFIFKEIEKNLEQFKLTSDLFTDLLNALGDVNEQLSENRNELIQNKKYQESILLKWKEKIVKLDEIRKEYTTKIDNRREWWNVSFDNLYNKDNELLPYNDSVDIHSLEYLRQVYSIVDKIETDANKYKDYMNRYKEISEDWINRIEIKSPKDQEDLRNTYIANTNVIGTTCSKSGTFNFRNEYGIFDVVIVDEISKATAIELLLPLLLGKKVILIGDDKQLPPMIGSDTLIDLANETGCSDEELLHLEKSIFSELWESAPDEIKTMLKQQYRMHSSIMNVINQFYDYQLEMGLDNQDEKRVHGCNTSHIIKNNHTIWVDTPIEESFNEEKVGTSFKNEAELSIIKSIVKELNEAWKSDKHKGNPAKQVGIITFYAHQARRLEETFIDNNDLYPNLSFRIGTVDRFQGIERPVVIVSMVRNNKIGKIGFADKPERINVAFSRAQELLVIIGCARLFCSKTHSISARKIYNNVANVIRHEGKLTDVSKFINT